MSARMLWLPTVKGGCAEENVGRLSRWRCCVVDATLDVRQGVIWISEEEVAPACTALMNAAGE
jgi:hypothetical protein